MKTEIKLKDDIKAKIDKILKKDKYEDLNDFMNRAAETLLMAEEQAKKFQLPKKK